MEKKLLFLDLDGTLLNDKKEITPGNRAALEQALEKGHGVVIATGRPLQGAVDQARTLGLDQPGCYLIAYNGTVIFDWKTRQELFRRDLDPETVYAVFDRAKEQRIHIQTYDARDVLVEKLCDDENIRRYCRETNTTFRVLEDIRTGLQIRPVKMLMSDYESKESLLEMEDWIRSHMADRADCFFSCETYLEVVPRGINKGEAVKLLCAALEVPLHNAVAVGDAANDIPMIAAAGVGVAMANGTDAVKAVADYVTVRDNNLDGVAEVVERFFL